GRLRQEVLPLIAEDNSLEYWQEAAFNVLSDSTPATADKLPNTGIDMSIEQKLSSIYINPVDLTGLEDGFIPNYGTRTQSILTLRQDSKNAKVTATIVSREFDYLSNPQ